MEYKLLVGTSIVDYEGRPLLDENRVPVQLRKVFMAIVGNYVPQGQYANENDAAAESIVAYAIGLKMHQSKTEVYLTEEEFVLLEKIARVPKHNAVIYKHVQDAITNAERIEQTEGEN